VRSPIAGAAICAGREAALSALVELNGTTTNTSALPPLAPERVRPDLYEPKPALQRSNVPPAEPSRQPRNGGYPQAFQRKPSSPRLVVACPVDVASCANVAGMFCTPGCFHRQPVTEAGQNWPINLATCDGCSIQSMNVVSSPDSGSLSHLNTPHGHSAAHFHIHHR